MSRAEEIAKNICSKSLSEQFYYKALIADMVHYFSMGALFSKPNTCAGKNMRRLAALYSEVYSILEVMI